MLFTVVVPVFNRAHIVSRTLDSIAAQSHRPLRIVIVDNASSDDSLDVVSRWADAHRSHDLQIDIFSETRPGACAARNRGLQEVTTPYVIFFDSDDTMRPGLIDAYAKAFKQNPHARIAVTGVSIHSLDDKTRNFPVTHVSLDSLIIKHLQHAWLRTQGYAARTDAIRACGAWNESLPRWNDLEFGLRLLLYIGSQYSQHTDVVEFIPGIYVDIYAQRESITGTSFSAHAPALRIALDTLTRDILASPYTYNNIATNNITTPISPENLTRVTTPASPESLTRAARRNLFMVDLRRAILAATCAREHAIPTSSLKENEPPCPLTEPPTSTLYSRLLIRLAYHLTRHGIRGASRLIALYRPR